jgi:hypothetical protein
MNEIAISLGENVCQGIFGLVGMTEARCYDSFSMQQLGYVLVASLVLVLLWARVWARAE